MRRAYLLWSSTYSAPPLLQALTYLGNKFNLVPKHVRFHEHNINTDSKDLLLDIYVIVVFDIFHSFSPAGVDETFVGRPRAVLAG